MNDQNTNIKDENQDVEVVECEVVEGTIVDPKPVNDSGLGKIILGAVIGAGAMLVYKNKSKFEERRIRKLEKKGYKITKPTLTEPTADPNEVVEAEFEETSDVK